MPYRMAWTCTTHGMAVSSCQCWSMHVVMSLIRGIQLAFVFNLSTDCSSQKIQAWASLTPREVQNRHMHISPNFGQYSNVGDFNLSLTPSRAQKLARNPPYLRSAGRAAIISDLQTSIRIQDTLKLPSCTSNCCIIDVGLGRERTGVSIVPYDKKSSSQNCGILLLTRV